MSYIVLTSMPDPDLAARWNDLVRDASLPTHYVTPNYFTDPYVRGERFAVLAVGGEGTINAALTGIKTGDGVVSGMFSRPQMVFRRGVDREKTAAELLAGMSETGGNSAKLIELYAWEPMSEFAAVGLSSRESNDTTSVVMLDLAAGADAVFAGFSQTRRNEIRKGFKQGTVEIKQLETDQELAEIYQIHCDWNARKGHAPDTLEQMRTAVGQTENRRVFIAKVDGKVVAGSFYRFCPGGVVEYAANFSMPEYQKLRPNDLIGWHAIKWACENGSSHFSMGGSHLFLRRFGGEIVRTYRYRKDLSTFKMHDIRERMREIAAGAFRRLPTNVRDSVRKVLARSMNSEKDHKKTLGDAANTELRGRDILCFSHDWTGDPLSKTHLMRVLAKENRILWINAIANRMPTTSSKDMSRIYKKLKGFTEPIREVEPNIFVLNPLAIPAYGNKTIVSLNKRALIGQVKRAMKRLGFSNVINMVFNPAAGMIAGKLSESELIYYCVDEYTAFTGSSALKDIEEELFRVSDLVIVSAEKLYDSKKQFNPNTHIIRHGTDWRHFRTAIDGGLETPGDIADLPRPIIGFHGLLADWVDFELIRKTAEHFKDGSVVLVGKIAVDAEQKVKILNDVPNVHFLGRKPYADLPAYCRAFDVALNPFAINELTLAANPLKVREYLAAGLPVVSTDIPEVRVLPDCLVGTSHEDFISKIEDALAHPKPREAVSDAIAHESWEAKIDELREIMSRERLRKAA